MGIEFVGNVGERKRREVRPDQRDIGGKAGHPFVHIVKGLEIGKLDEKDLLKRVLDKRSLGEQQIEIFFDQSWDFERVKR